MNKLNLKVLLAEANLSQQQYADFIGVAKQNVNVWVKTNNMPKKRNGDLIELVELANKNCGRYEEELESLNKSKGWLW